MNAQKTYKNLEEFFDDYTEKINSSHRLFTEFMDDNIIFVMNIPSEGEEGRIKTTMLSEFGISLVLNGSLSRGKKIIREAMDLAEKNGGLDSCMSIDLKEHLLWTYGTALHDTEEYDEAIKVFGTLLEKYPDNDRYKNWYNGSRSSRVRKYSRILWWVLWAWLFYTYFGPDYFDVEIGIYTQYFGALIFALALYSEFYIYVLKKK